MPNRDDTQSPPTTPITPITPTTPTTPALATNGSAPAFRTRN